MYIAILHDGQRTVLLSGCGQPSLGLTTSNLDLSCVQLDGSHTPAKNGGAAVGYQGRKSARTTNMLFLAGNQGIMLACAEPQAGNQLLILDDFGIQPFDAQSRAALMEIIEDRHGKTSLIITSQLPVSKWHEVIGEKTIADATLDRIVHSAHRIELTGGSMRKKRQPEPENNCH